MPAPSTPQTIPDVTEDIETGSGSGLGRSRDNGIFDQMRANDAVYFCFGSRTAIGQMRKFDAETALSSSDPQPCRITLLGGIDGDHRSDSRPHRYSATVTRKNVAGMEVMSLCELLFCARNRSSSCVCKSATRPLLPAASNAFMVGP